jgi:hypothetical protein
MESAKSVPGDATADLPRPVYPSIEAFIEQASPEEVSSFFSSLKDGLAVLKGPRVEMAKKISGAIQAVEELLFQLLEIRAKLGAEHPEKR